MISLLPARPLARPRDRAAVSFVLCGQVRSGAGLLRGCLAGHDRAYCHANLLHDDAACRREAYESYFGLSPEPTGRKGKSARPPHFFTPEASSAQSYLTTFVLRRLERQEAALGLFVPYPVLEKYQLYDLLSDGPTPLRLVHVERNPIACYLSLRQAQESRRWGLPGGDTADEPRPLPVEVDADVLAGFVRRQLATRCRLTQVRVPRLTLTFSRLVTDLHGAMAEICGFLGLPGQRVRPLTRRLKNRPVERRVSDWRGLCDALPSDLRYLLDEELC